MITKFKLFENKSNTLTLYHGTSDIIGDYLIENGWKPRQSSGSGNMGNPKYLYVTTDPEDARWFSNEIGEDTVIEIIDVPIEFLRPDPEDEAGFTMDDLLKRKVTGLPSKFIITQPLDKNYFKKYEN